MVFSVSRVVGVRLTCACGVRLSLQLCTDRTCAAIGAGLPFLQSLSLAGCELVTETGLCYLGRGCRDLQVLNVSGCRGVSVRGLDMLIAGLPYVEVSSACCVDWTDGPRLHRVRSLLHSVRRRTLGTSRWLTS